MHCFALHLKKKHTSGVFTSYAQELLNRRTEKMLLSVQRAQEEAQKDKQLQRIRDLARKGHDVSKLLGSLERRSTESVQSKPTAVRTGLDLQTPEGLGIWSQFYISLFIYTVHTYTTSQKFGHTSNSVLLLHCRLKGKFGF